MYILGFNFLGHLGFSEFFWLSQVKYDMRNGMTSQTGCKTVDLKYCVLHKNIPGEHLTH